MDSRRLDGFLHNLRQMIGTPGSLALSDGQLLERFVATRDDAAFELLVRRHGNLVWNVCRRLLGNAADADDAFQAVFLVLVRKAARLDRAGSVGPWLYSVAHRVALRARANRNRQRDRDRLIPPRADEARDPDFGELRELLDAELARLPEKYRAALVLCDLEGKTHEEAARELCWPLGTLKCRVLRGRDQLRARLTRRGLALSVTTLGALLSTEAVRAQAPAVLVESTVRAALTYAAGRPVAAAAVGLAEGAIRAMFLTKLKFTAAVLVACLTLGGTGVLTYRAAADSGAGAAPQAAANPEKPAPAEPAGEKEHPLAAAWDDLASDDEARALPAVLAFAKDPKVTLPFLKERVKPVLVDARRLAQLVADLDSEKFPVRDKATKELENLGEYAVPYLQSALDAKPALEMRKRIESLLLRLKSPVRPASWVQTARALAVLEQIGSEEARKIVETVSKGRAKAGPTQEAEATLDRMDAKPPVTMKRQWEDLSCKDDGKVARALLGMAATPKETVAFLKELIDKKALKSAVQDERVTGLIADLDNESFDVRARATRELIVLGQEAVPALQQALKKDNPKPSLESRLSMEELLAVIAKRAATLPPPGPNVPVQPQSGTTSVLVKRLSVLVVYVGTDEAKELLEAIKASKLLSGQGGKEAISPDGKVRATGSEDGTITVFDVASGKQIRSMKQHRAAVQVVVFSPDGTRLVSGSSDGMLCTWDNATGALLWFTQGIAGGVTGILFSEDGLNLTITSGNKTTYGYDPASGKLVSKQAS